MSVALTIAGSDPSGGAGLQADLKTFHQHGVYGASVVTLLTVQNTQQVSGIEFLSPQFVRAQLDAVLEDIPPQAAKTGALGNAAMIEMVASAAEQFAFPLVVDPVMISKHGHALIDQTAIESLKRKLLPHAFLLTPNLREAAELTGRKIESPGDWRDAAKGLVELGARHVLIKGGSRGDTVVDLLWTAGEFHEFSGPRIESRCQHGTGCVLSAAITARLARGEPLLPAVAAARRFVAAAIASGPGLGKGISPINLFVAVD